jgi:2-methylisocitrate lyase-like PEP mutase family enzyme
LNILAGPGSASLPEYQKAGVARVSLGSAAMRATLGALQRIAKELTSSGTYQSLEGAPSHSEVNRLMQ